MPKLSEYSRVMLAFDSIIKGSLDAYEGEATCPGSNADASDDFIRFHRDRVRELRMIRESFENVMSKTFTRMPL